MYFTIEKHGKVSHALGTRHFGVDVTLFPPSVSSTIFHHAKVAVFETAPGDEGAVPNPPVALPALLGAPAWAHLRELVGASRAAALENVQPMYAALVVPSIYEDLSSQLDDELGKLATDAKIPTKGLESALSQDQILHDVFDADVARAIVMSIKNRDQIKADTARDLGDYCKGNPGTGGFDAQTRGYFKAAGFDDAKIAQLEEHRVPRERPRGSPSSSRCSIPAAPSSRSVPIISSGRAGSSRC